MAQGPLLKSLRHLMDITFDTCIPLSPLPCQRKGNYCMCDNVMFTFLFGTELLCMLSLYFLKLHESCMGEYVIHFLSKIHEDLLFHNNMHACLVCITFICMTA